MAQIIFNTQASVDSFAQNIDTSTNYFLRFVYDSTSNDPISDLSAFNNNRYLNVELWYFPWKDIPFFTSHQGGRIHLKNMKHITTISGVKNTRGPLYIEGDYGSNSLPPKGLLKTCHDLKIWNLKKDTLKIDLTDAQRMDGKISNNTLFLWKNSIKYLEINDPNGAVTSLEIYGDSTLQHLHVNSGTQLYLVIDHNPQLDTVRGFEKLDTLFLGGITYNTKLQDLCVIRDELDELYQSLSPQEKASFESRRLHSNGKGASSYAEIMAYDCTWFETLGVQNNSAMSIYETSIYPNPAVDFITIEVAAGNIAQFEIINAKGQVALAKQAISPDNKSHIFLEHLPSGLYLIGLYNSLGEFVGHKKLVVQ